MSRPLSMPADRLCLLRGAGDLATGVAWRLTRAGFPVVTTELANPLTVRRAVALSTAVFLVLAWYRLVQLRPELLTLAGVLCLQHLLFAPALPSWRRVAASVGLVWLWANVHAAFMLGPLLIAAALAGVAARFAMAAWAGVGISSSPTTPVAMAATS